MTRLLRNAHYFAIGVHFVGLCIFTGMYARTGLGLWAFMAGWACVFGASHTAALVADRKAAQTVEGGEGG